MQICFLCVCTCVCFDDMYMYIYIYIFFFFSGQKFTMEHPEPCFSWMIQLKVRYYFLRSIRDQLYKHFYDPTDSKSYKYVDD